MVNQCKLFHKNPFHNRDCCLDKVKTANQPTNEFLQQHTQSCVLFYNGRSAIVSFCLF